MDTENIIMILTALFGGGGVIALLKARSEIKNSDKNADIQALKNALETIENANRELQEQYQDALTENESRCNQLSDRLHQIEIRYVEQSQKYNESIKRITDLEIDLRKAHNKIEILEEELKRKNTDLMRLEQENIELRKRQNKLGLMNDKTNT